MNKSQAAKLERLTITLPIKLITDIEGILAKGTYATATEWIRHAIREQLARDLSPMEALLEREPGVAESLSEAREGRSVQVDLDELLK
ncbi:MAG TPA: ribbon-helix-helix domain-containing protein [Fimbriimonas sp.]|nr:ribbon-helix-helix domain-containing protein [Fimbriimonas sp.]